MPLVPRRRLGEKISIPLGRMPSKPHHTAAEIPHRHPAGPAQSSAAFIFCAGEEGTATSLNTAGSTLWMRPARARPCRRESLTPKSLAWWRWKVPYCLATSRRRGVSGDDSVIRRPSRRSAGGSVACSTDRRGSLLRRPRLDPTFCISCAVCAQGCRNLGRVGAFAPRGTPAHAVVSGRRKVDWAHDGRSATALA